MASKIQTLVFMPQRKRPRVMNGGHLNFIRKLPCVICGDDTSTEAAHVRMSSIRFAKQQAGMGAKPSDSWTLPMCGNHHRMQHEKGEREFWKDRKDPLILALALWQASGDYERALIIIRNAK